MTNPAKAIAKLLGRRRFDILVALLVSTVAAGVSVALALSGRHFLDSSFLSGLPAGLPAWAALLSIAVPFFLASNRLLLGRFQSKRQASVEDDIRRSTRERLERSLKEGAPVVAPVLQVEDLRREGVDLQGVLRAQRKGKFEVASDQSEHYRAAIEVGRRHLGSPRAVVRFVNRVRILMYLAVTQGLFARSDPISPQSIGLWAVVVERWPALAQAFLERPERAMDLASAAQADAAFRQARADKGLRGAHGSSRSWPEVQRLAAALAPSCQDDPDLGPFFANSPATCWSRDLPRIVKVTTNPEGQGPGDGGRAIAAASA
jgi:hypothetical protein